MNFPKLYECDPQKNTECNKRNCGNPCKHTTRKEFARERTPRESRCNNANEKNPDGVCVLQILRKHGRKTGI